MNKVEISILVPIYNVEKYLHRCIESVLNQDFQNWELVLIDDGSKDNCGKICDEYATKNPEKIKVIHKENGGHSSARFEGFKKASGEYIMFLDSDDWLLSNALSVLYNKIIEGYDVVKGINRRVKIDGSYSIERHKIYNEEIIGTENYLSKVIKAEVAPYLWGGLYKKDLIKEEDIKRVRDFSVGEDWLLNITIANRVKKMVCINKEICCYFINPNSIMQTKVCSFEYSYRMKTILESLTENNTNDIKYLIKINVTKGLIYNFFIPELKFQNMNYNILINNLKDIDIYNYIKHNIKKRFIFCVKYRHIFYAYTSIYKFLYYVCKLSCKERQVLY